MGQRAGFRGRDKVRDYVREERARDYAAGLAWGLGGSGSSGYGSGHGSGSGSDSGYGTGYSSGYGPAPATVTRTPTRPPTRRPPTATPLARTRPRRPSRTASRTAAAAERGYQAFDRARDAFKAGDYAAALDLTDAALKDVPGDPLVHEFKALVLFARGEDARAAAELHAVLAVRPGMDWTTLIGLYPDVETYTGQLRALEDRCRQDPKAAAPRFVLAYHYLVAGHKDAAVAQLKALLALEPGDRVARRLLASLTGTPPAPPEPTRLDRARPRRGRRPTPVGGPRRPLEGRPRRVDVRPEPRRPGPVPLAGGTPGEGHRHRLRRLRPLGGHADPQSRGPVSSPCLRDRVVSGLLPIQDRR